MPKHSRGSWLWWLFGNFRTARSAIYQHIRACVGPVRLETSSLRKSSQSFEHCLQSFQPSFIMASFAKTVSHQATSSRATIAILSSQHERGTPPHPSRIHPPYACGQYPEVQDTVERKRNPLRSLKSRGPKKQRNDINKHRSFPVKNPPDRIPNRQASCQDTAFLSLQSYQSVNLDCNTCVH